MGPEAEEKRQEITGVILHEYMAEMTLERLEEDPEGPGILRAARRGLQEGHWNDEYVSAIGQHPLSRPPSWPLPQIAAFTEVHAMILSGSVAELLIPVGEKPRPDANREGNASVLARLPHPFRAAVSMDQGNAEGDGTLAWDCPIPVSLSTGLIARHDDGSTHPLPVRFTIPPGNAVLEIGSTQPSRTLAHLIYTSAGVARWPYGYQRIRLLVNLDPETYLGSRLAKAMKPYRKVRA
jgi:hypothetical protein